MRVARVRMGMGMGMGMGLRCRILGRGHPGDDRGNVWVGKGEGRGSILAHFPLYDFVSF